MRRCWSQMSHAAHAGTVAALIMDLRGKIQIEHRRRGPVHSKLLIGAWSKKCLTPSCKITQIFHIATEMRGTSNFSQPGGKLLVLHTKFEWA